MEGGKLTVLILILLGVLAVGTVGYMNIEGMRTIDALYMTAITVSTVGFGEVHPLSDEGKLFTIGLMIVGIGVVIYAITYLGSLVVEPAIRRTRFSRQSLSDSLLLEEERETADIIDLANNHEDVILKEIKITARSGLANKPKSEILKRRGIIVMAVKDKAGNFKTGINMNQKFKSGDFILVMGTLDQLKKY